ncbi:hypothetical protein, partial [Sphingomonas sp. Ant H11]|uniref:hypothetical protein n=1 Tax=Sphingomonas sp. Ant H11 TaxID=1564113 RepID=UPI003FA770C3
SLIVSSRGATVEAVVSVALDGARVPGSAEVALAPGPLVTLEMTGGCGSRFGTVAAWRSCRWQRCGAGRRGSSSCGCAGAGRSGWRGSSG